MQKKLFLLMIMAFYFCISIFAQTTGQIVGQLRDENGRTVEGATVFLEEDISKHSLSEANGQFSIINITPGVYNLRIQHSSYVPLVLSNVRVNVDNTTRISPNQTVLKVMLHEQEVINVTATSTMLNIDGGSGSQVDKEALQNMPSRTLDGVISSTAGVTSQDGQLFVRGGRANEVTFTVDGMSVSDPVDGGRALSVDLDAIADMKIMTGGFTAEYGNAQSGMVNIVTKEGTEKWEGKIEGITDHGHQLVKGNNYDELKFSIGGPVPIYFLNQDLKRKFTFFLNGASSWTDSRYREHFKGDPNVDLKYLRNWDYDNYDPYSGRDNILGFDIGNRNYNTYNLNLKTVYKFTATRKLTIAARGDRSYSTPFSHEWRYALQHYLESESRQYQVLGTYDHVFDIRRNLQIKASYFTTITKQNPRGINKTNILRDIEADGQEIVFDPKNGQYGFVSINKNGDGIYDYYGKYPSTSEWNYSIIQLNDPKNISGFNAPGTIWDNFIDDESSQYSFRADYEYQMNQIVGMKTGFELIQHQIMKDQLSNFLSRDPARQIEYLTQNCVIQYYSVQMGKDDDGEPIITPIDPLEYEEKYGHLPSSERPPIVDNLYSQEDYLKAELASLGQRNGYKAEPLQFAYYLQTKMDWEGMIVNAGLRFDMWYLGDGYQILQDNGTYRKNNPVYKRDAEGNIMYDANDSPIISRYNGFASSERTQLMLSPRLSVSHPISERDVIYFAYNYQNQLPPMRYVFTTTDTLDAYNTAGVQVGNPGLKPQITVSYEVGLQHLLTENLVFGLTAYYKNIYNYVSTRKLASQSESAIYWYEYISEDYGSAKGLDFTLNRRMVNYISGGINYSLAWANGNNSSTRTVDEKNNLREFPLDWDIRHQFNLNVVYRVARGEEFIIPFTEIIVPFDDYFVSLGYNIASGSPYTPETLTGQQLEINSKRLPYTTTADLRIGKSFNFGDSSSIRASFTIENLFKKRNVLEVHPKTGSPYYDGADLTEAATGDVVWEETQWIHDMYTKDPSMTNNNRNYILGLSYNF